MSKEPANEAYQEILRLDAMLTKAGIKHQLDRTEDGWQLCYPKNQNFKCSVVEFSGSFGCKMDRLEIMGLLNKEERKYDVVVGYLTAENVFQRIKAHHARQNQRRKP